MRFLYSALLILSANFDSWSLDTLVTKFSMDSGRAIIPKRITTNNDSLISWGEKLIDSLGSFYRRDSNKTYNKITVDTITGIDSVIMNTYVDLDSFITFSTDSAVKVGLAFVSNSDATPNAGDTTCIEVTGVSPSQVIGVFANVQSEDDGKYYPTVDFGFPFNEANEFYVLTTDPAKICWWLGTAAVADDFPGAVVSQGPGWRVAIVVYTE